MKVLEVTERRRLVPPIRKRQTVAPIIAKRGNAVVNHVAENTSVVLVLRVTRPDASSQLQSSVISYAKTTHQGSQMLTKWPSG
jgi:DNA-binding GntR family transcriptional regulator